jgi:GMP synthase-like glutamine amidotransferase
MKPVAIFRHAAPEGPGHFATFLEAQAIPWRLFRIDAGDAVPADARDFSGLAFMGGPMSVNDDLPWIPHSLALIRQAREHAVPLLGHCLGGQLIAKALGGTVTRNPVKEIGWGEATLAAEPEAQNWFGAAQRIPVFHWHGETFSLPPGAQRLLSSPYCVNQAFLLDGRHLAMQCHVEMTAAMVEEWCAIGQDEIDAATSSPGVQSAQTIRTNLAQRIAALHGVAETVYRQWVRQLKS